MKILEKIKEILKNIGKKAPKTIAAGATIATVGLATSCGANNEAVVDNNVKVEQENSYKDSLKVSLGNLGNVIYQESQEKSIEEKVDEMESIDDLLAVFKDSYIEDYEKKTGDTSLTTADIELWEKTQDRVYVDNNTGVMYTHGDAPEVTEQKLAELGINYSDKENVEIYEIMKKDGEVIDCAALEDEKLEKVILSQDLSTDKEYASILTTEKYRRLVPVVFECRKFMEQESELGVTRAKNEMIEILKEFEKENDDGFEHE